LGFLRLTAGNSAIFLKCVAFLTIMKSIHVCPKCGSIRISEFTGQLHAGPAEQIISLCKDCGYLGNMPLVDVDKVEEFRENLKKD